MPLTVVIAAVVLTMPSRVAAQATDPWVGVWKENLANSQGQPFRNVIVYDRQ